MNDERPSGPGLPERKHELSIEDRRHFQTLDAKLQLVRDRTRSVAFGYDTGFYLYGSTGVGKTFTVLTELDRLKVPYRVTNARVSAWALFDMLEKYPDEVFVIDDVKQLTRNPHAVSILLAALWGTGKRDRFGRQERFVSYRTHGDSERSFVFLGAIVLIGNRPLGDEPELDALEARVPCLQLTASDREIAAFMRHVALQGYRYDDRVLTPEESMEIVEFVIAQALALRQPLDLRLIEHGYTDFLQWDNGESAHHWRDLIASRLRKRSASLENLEPTGVRAAKKARELIVAREIMDVMPCDERLRQWAERTGKSEATLYRRLSELGRLDASVFEN